MNHPKWSIAFVLVAGLTGCNIFPYGDYTNVRQVDADPTAGEQTSFTIRKQRVASACAGKDVSDPKKQKDVLVLLALSGGGSRAAYFSALSMLEMEKMKITVAGSQSDLMHEVDAISSVSGGSLAAAYYAVTTDTGSECAGHSGRFWDVPHSQSVQKRMTRDFRNRWLGNWFWPTNILAFWLSEYDRTDIMAQTLADNLFDRRLNGLDLRFGELNPLRPNLIVNATAGSIDRRGQIRFGQVFTFTREDFSRLCSSISDYSVARGVMASATFPGVFNFMTLRDQCLNKNQVEFEEERYLHVFDGGNGDNLGLTSLKRLIWTSLLDRDNEPVLPYKHVVVIQVDAYIESQGADPSKNDPRHAYDYILDTNFIDATDSLLEANRDRLLAEFRRHSIFPFASAEQNVVNEQCTKFFTSFDNRNCKRPAAYWNKLNRQIGDKLTFVHLSFDKLGSASGCKDKHGQPVATGTCLVEQLNRISTDFKLSSTTDPRTGLTDPEALACAVPLLFDHPVPGVCGDLVPAGNAALARDWEQVQAILQNPDSERRQLPLAAAPALQH